MLPVSAVYRYLIKLNVTGLVLHECLVIVLALQRVVPH
jgi:hypothetical protein